MKKLQLLSILTLLFISSAFGQIDTKELESENQKLKAEIVIKKETISKLEGEVNYLKETLDLIDSKISKDEKDVSFKINLVEGDLDTGKIIIEGILINNGVVRSIQGQKANAFDPKGNGINSYKVKFGDVAKISKLLKDVPVKFNIELDPISDAPPILKALTVYFYSNVGYKKDPINVVFKNLNVIWK
ncbi:hypothetical protein QSV08_11665 [Maribacter sp. BPC-D8]|uniref:hypothetical protein n=1 Tax=Maribacter sp. BPC-D8 TaxID=3053613 RepID=UPI002B475670|nr:hypothetical protein [Maribacter sp. BPC-D8]WRI27881.1 hypothetical protein QSV08_11665 [Maribacter sp. BPC-D8]